MYRIHYDDDDDDDDDDDVMTCFDIAYPLRCSVYA